MVKREKERKEEEQEVVVVVEEEEDMSDCKRCSPSIAAMEASSGEASVSKRRKTASCEFQLCSSDAKRLQNSHYSPANFPDATVSPEDSVDSAGAVASGEFCSDRSPLSCCSSTYVVEVLKELNTTPLDLKVQTKGFETVVSTFHNFKSHSLLSESCGDSEESSLPPPVSEQRKFPEAKVPPKEEIEEFFAMAEKYEQKRFAEKYNFDIVKDMPLEGRYQWVRLN